MVIDQMFGEDWVAYNADCVLAMSELPDSSVDFNLHSPPFLALYIYSDNIADLGNTSSESEFFIGYRFALEEMYRILKPGGRVAIHCKDTMRYITSHGYAGLYDFPGDIVRVCDEVGFKLDRWITIWKDPVVEMQRTKTYGLLHKSFATRAEVTRQGCPDYVLVFQKLPFDSEPKEDFKPLPEDVIRRITHQWSQDGESVTVNSFGTELERGHLSIWDYKDTLDPIQMSEKTEHGRLCVVHCQGPGEMPKVIKSFQDTDIWKFHSRCALTDGTFLVTFRNWTDELRRNYHELNGVVKHNLKPPNVDDWHTFKQYSQHVKVEDDIIISHSEDEYVEWKEPVLTGREVHPDYVGTNPPMGWRDDDYYSILVWQKYASPVWFDLKGLPPNHPDILMDIKQTNVLNTNLRSKDERHICPLQLDLIDKLILQYTDEGDIVFSPYGGIGSEGVGALKRFRKAILTELKPEYWELCCLHLEEISKARMQRRLF